MWIHQFFTNAPVDFEKQCKKRMITGLVLILLGAVTVCLAIWAEANPEILASWGGSNFIYSFYTGCGSGLVGGGIATLLINRRYLKNPELRRKKEIAETDERNRMLGLRCWAYAGYSMFLFLYIGMLFAGLFSQTVLHVLMIVGGVYGLMLLIFRILLQKAM